MSVTAAMVKQLRERTGAGMMECKRALVETAGDIDAAAELMRKSGQAKADKKAGNIAAEGIVVIAGDSSNDGVIVEINCQTDFVAKDASFLAFANSVAELVNRERPQDPAALAALKLDGDHTVDEARRELVAKIGEKIDVRRFRAVAGGERLGAYLHGQRIGVLVAMSGGDEDLARDVAMHIAASNPECVDASGLDPARLAKEREIYVEQMKDSGKPAEIMDKIIEGKMAKFTNAITLLGQPFVKDDKVTVGKLLKQHGAKVVEFARFEVGEGIEKKQENFAEEVRKQVEASDG